MYQITAQEYEAIAEAMTERAYHFGRGYDEVEVSLNNGKLTFPLEFRYEFEERLIKGDYWTPDDYEMLWEEFSITDECIAYDEEDNEVETSFSIAMLAKASTLEGIRIS